MRNWKQFLNNNKDQLDNMNDREVVNFFRKHFKRIGKGSSREVFELSNRWVVKVAFNELGLLQNETEILVYDDFVDYCSEVASTKQYFAKIDVELSCYNYVIMERITPMGKGSRSLVKQLHRKKFENTKLGRFTKRMFKRITELEQVGDVIIVSDLMPRNFGYNVDGVYKICDYGLSRHAWKVGYSYKHKDAAMIKPF